MLVGATALPFRRALAVGVPTRPCLRITPDAVSPDEETALVSQVDPWLSRKKYEGGHFDKVITQYRELQKATRFFSGPNRTTMERLVRFAFTEPETPLLPVHILDLAAEGVIGPHVDHVEYSGRYIVGLSLLSDCVLTMHRESDGVTAEYHLPRRSLYVMVDESRYEWAHAIHAQPKGRRITLLFRDRLDPDER